MDAEGRLIVITGAIGSGKTTLCSQLAAYFHAAGWKVSGLISRGEFTGNKKEAIKVENINDGEIRQLATYRQLPESGENETMPLHWNFDPEVLNWGNRVFQQIEETDLLVVDELGPLEINRNEGWTAAERLLDERKFRLAILVMRPSLLSKAIKKWPYAEVIMLENVEKLPAVMKEILDAWKIECK